MSLTLSEPSSSARRAAQFARPSHTRSARSARSFSGHSFVAGRPASLADLHCSSSKTGGDQPPHCTGALVGGNVASDSDVVLDKTQVAGSVLGRDDVHLAKSRIDKNVYYGDDFRRDQKSIVSGQVQRLGAGPSLCLCGSTLAEVLADRALHNNNGLLDTRYYDAQARRLTLPKNQRLILPSGKFLVQSVALEHGASLAAEGNTVELSIKEAPKALELDADPAAGGSFTLILGGDECDCRGNHHGDHHDSGSRRWPTVTSDDDHGQRDFAPWGDHDDDDDDHDGDDHDGDDHDGAHDCSATALDVYGVVSIYAPRTHLTLKRGYVIGRIVAASFEAENQTFDSGSHSNTCRAACL